MKILIHSLETGLYLAQEDRWVEPLSGARDFLQASAAIKYASTLGLKDVELTYAFPSDEYNISIPLTRPDVPAKRSTA